MCGQYVDTDSEVCETAETVPGHLRPGSILAVHSSVDPQTCTRIGVAAWPREAAVVDAQVSGGTRMCLRW
jgi:3-hydroxyisobutyrate dehydrogenase-like beta-hydroxyacid dehydrogenase